MITAVGLIIWDVCVCVSIGIGLGKFLAHGIIYFGQSKDLPLFICSLLTFSNAVVLRRLYKFLLS